MKWHGMMIGVFIACVQPGCKADSADKGSSAGSGSAVAPPAGAADRQALIGSAETTLAALVAHESKADVTCWTSFRQLDWFIAEKTYSEYATLAKITAIKALVRAVWVKASAAETGDVLSADSVTKALGGLPAIELDPDKAAELGTFTNGIGLRNFSDYQKTAEQWRIVLSVIQDEIYYGSGDDVVKPIEADALTALADVATTLSLHLLKRAGAAAAAAKSKEIEAEHVVEAFTSIARDAGLTNKKRSVKPLDLKQVSALLLPLTSKLIEGKAKALVVFNRASGDLAVDLSRVSELPIDKEAADVFLRRAKSFAHFATSGVDPMRADNYLSDGSFEKTRMLRKPYLDHLQLQNVVQQVLPHHMLPNGDIVVRFEPNPGPQTNQTFKPFEIRMLDHRMNGVRDSAIHWLAMAEVFQDRAYTIDPFAAEYLSEVISMFVTLQIERAIRLAKKEGKKAINADVARRIESKTYVMVPPVQRATSRGDWDARWAAKKKAALGPLGRALFADVSARSGLPQKLNLVRQPGGVEGHGVSKKPVEGHGVSKKPVEGHGVSKKPVEGHGVSKKPVEGHGISGHVGHAGFNIQTIMGAGTAVGDVNNDGYPDMFLNGEGIGRLFINRGKENPGVFVDQTGKWKLPSRLDDGHGTLLFDLEGDGDLDLLVLRSESASAIYRQEGGAFVNASKALGFTAGRGAHVAHVFDYDNDGDLDLYIGYYGSKKAHDDPKEQSLPSLDGRNGSPNQLWRNDGDKLTEVGAAAGVADVGWTLAVASFDLEMDGDLDLYMANDFGANAMFRNDGGGKFSDVTLETHTGDRGSGMNVDFSDVNGDGRWDIYITNIDMFSKRIKVVFPRDESTIDLDRELAESFQYLSGNKLYVSTPGGSLRAAEDELIEPGDRGWGWDALFFDYENDGDDDLYLTNGWIEGSYAGGQKNQMFIFEEVFHLASESSPEAVAGNSRSLAAADFDRDGDIDIVLNQFRAPPVMLENTQKRGNKWIAIELAGGGKNPRAIGALVRVKAGGRSIMRQVSAGRGYLSQTEARLVIGVGKASSVDVEVMWPGGAKTSHPKLGTGKVHQLKR